MFDGYPIYGAFGYTSNANKTAKIILSSYRTKSITSRTTTVNKIDYSGPTINSTYPLGAFLEDYEYVSGLGDLDEHNGN